MPDTSPDLSIPERELNADDARDALKDALADLAHVLHAEGSASVGAHLMREVSLAFHGAMEHYEAERGRVAVVAGDGGRLPDAPARPDVEA